MPPLDEAYFVWLYSQVGSVDSRNRSNTYWTLLRLLYTKEFTWSGIEKDENRAQDGKDLRRQFLEDTHTRMTEPGWLDLGCSFLELLLSLAWKLEWQDDRKTQAEWFWILIENLGLIECNDVHPPDEVVLNSILDRVINRSYTKNGRGGLFPLQNAAQDQRQVEIWYQAEAFLLERL